MRIVRLMSTAPVRKRRSIYKKVLTASEWRAKYKALVWWYFKKAKQNSYKNFAVFTVL